MKTRIFLSCLTVILFSLLGCASIQDNGYIIYSLWFLVVVGVLFVVSSAVYTYISYRKRRASQSSDSTPRRD